MKPRALRLLAILSFIAGIACIAASFSGITGAVIFEGLGDNFVSAIGIAFIVVGAILVSYTESEAYQARESKLRQIVGESRYEHLSEKDKIAYNKSYRRHIEAEERRRHKSQREILSPEKGVLDIKRTNHFNRVIRGYNERSLDRAIKKIGTGMGKEEKLDDGDWSIRVSKGDRIIYDRKKDGTIILKDLILDDEYSRRV